MKHSPEISGSESFVRPTREDVEGKGSRLVDLVMGAIHDTNFSPPYHNPPFAVQRIDSIRQEITDRKDLYTGYTDEDRSLLLEEFNRILVQELQKKGYTNEDALRKEAEDFA